VKPAALRYERPATLDDALALLAVHGDDAKVLAGGQSLVPLLNMRFARPSVVVDVNRIADLRGIADRHGETVVGAMVRQRELGDHPLVQSRLPLAAAALPLVGHFVTRNRGTVGGSIAHADARAELPLALLTHGGSVDAASHRGTRRIAAEDLFVTHFTTSLEPDELLVASAWPQLGNGWGTSFLELAQRHGDYALGMVAVALRLENGVIAEARVGIGAVGDRPVRVHAAERALLGARVDADAATAAAAEAVGAIDPVDDLHATARYRAHLTGVLVTRAVLAAWEDASR
jgi:carbon-monoxide dehydrogenase medium subunit